MKRIISIPAGKCPVKLNSSEKNSVVEWCEKIMLIGNENNIDYLPSALVFFSQQFFSIFSDEYKEVRQHINSIYSINEKEQLKMTNQIIDKTIYEKMILDKEKKDRMDGKITQEQVQPAKKRGRPKKVFSSPIIPTVISKENVNEEKIKLVAKRK